MFGREGGNLGLEIQVSDSLVLYEGYIQNKLENGGQGEGKGGNT